MANELGTWGIVTDPYVSPLKGPEYVLPVCGCVTQGEGVPNITDNPGDNNDVYIDTLTEFIYQIQNQVYVQIGGGGAGGQQVYRSEGDPNGVVLVTTELPCYCIDTTNHIGWIKIDGLKTATGWTVP